MKIFKKWPIKNVLGALLLLPVAALVFFLGNAIGSDKLPVSKGQEKKLPIYSVGTDEMKVAISFDAAWGNSHTRPILDILDEHGVKTTFFLVKFWAEKYPDDVKEIHSRGHEVENHSATHPDMTTIPPEKIKEEAELTGEVIEGLTGVRPRLFRPPFGAYNNCVIEGLEDLNYKVIQWSVDSLDWKELTADQIVARVVSKVEPGSIVLFHNDAGHVEEYLPRILKDLKEEGYEVVPIGQLVYKEDYYINHEGKQIDKGGRDIGKLPGDK